MLLHGIVFYSNRIRSAAAAAHDISGRRSATNGCSPYRTDACAFFFYLFIYVCAVLYFGPFEDRLHSATVNGYALASAGCLGTLSHPVRNLFNRHKCYGIIGHASLHFGTIVFRGLEV